MITKPKEKANVDWWVGGETRCAVRFRLWFGKGIKGGGGDCW